MKMRDPSEGVKSEKGVMGEGVDANTLPMLRWGSAHTTALTFVNTAHYIDAAIAVSSDIKINPAVGIIF